MNLGEFGVVRDSLETLWQGFLAFIPELVGAILLLIVGWIIGAILGKIVDHILKALKVDQGLRSAGVEDVLARGGVNLDSGKFVGALVKWFVIIAFLIAALAVLGLDQVNVFMQEILFYIPQVIVAVLVLVVAGVVGDIVKKVIVSSTRMTQLGVPAAIVGSIAKWAIWIFAILVALDQLGIAQALVQTLFTGIVIAVSLGLGLSFGLGGQSHASAFLDRVKSEMNHMHKE